MILNIFHLILAIFGLGFLVFIHELGHYLTARRAHITVEVFSIGFGKPIYSWEHEGVRWQLCWIPFGGYVRMAGMEKKGALEPYQIPDGFYGKKPLERIKVALAGPFVNILFAFFAFTLLWLCGGQEKPFQYYTNVIGEIYPHSQLYDSNVRPGDTLTAVDDVSVQGFNDLCTTILLSKKPEALKGLEIDYASGKKTPFSHPFDPKQSQTEIIQNLGIVPAQYLIFDHFSSPVSPMKESGIEKGDRLVWVNGEFVFSKDSLSQAVNEKAVLCTIKRAGQTFLSKLPRLKATDLKMDPAQKAELDDWQHAAKLGAKIHQLYFIPYNLNNACIVEGSLSYLDQNAEEKIPSETLRKPLNTPLLPGDQIIAVNGVPVKSSAELLEKLQTPNVLVIVQRMNTTSTPSWKVADAEFEGLIEPSALNTLFQNLMSGNFSSEGEPTVGSLRLLSSGPLLSFAELPLDPALRTQAIRQYEEEKKAIEKIEDEKEKALNLALLEQYQKRLMLGVSLIDKAVSYNPNPFVQFTSVVEQTWKTLVNLVTGYLSPKNMAGPIGIVQALQYSWSNGIKDALYWLGFVSLNLAFLNLLPIPALDGGHILLSLFEMVTKKPIRAKTMERLIVPFIVLLIGFFIYVTYQDLTKLFSRFF